MPDPQNVTTSFQLILDTAEQLIKEKGCRQTTLQDIINRSGLSKGAIYHYVSGKDELFGLILKTKVESMNAQFGSAVAEAGAQEAAGPIRFVAQSMLSQTDSQDVSNKIFTYLLSQVDNPKVAAILRELYVFSQQTAKRWIETGQQAGAIPSSVDTAKMASVFMVFTYGLRVQNVIAGDAGERVELNDIFKLLFHSLQ